MSDTEIDELYEASRIPDKDGTSSKFPGVFVLGSINRRVSFLAQQTRAVNLIHCLEKKGALSPDKKVAIIGGGVAGATAAVYAMSRGYQIQLLERHAQPMSLQAGSSRWLHPNIYDWPKAGWDNQSTLLPVMNWSAGYAVNVIGALRDQWDEAESRYMPDIHFLADVNTIKGGPPWEIGWDKGSVIADVVILAVGFGEEEDYKAIGSKPYWLDSDYHQRLRNGGVALVSGCGDGGFTDALRICLRDFQQQWLAEFGANHQVLEIGRQLLEIERNLDRFGSNSSLTKSYLSLSLPDDVMRELRVRSNAGVHVILNGGSEAPLTRESCILHRLLVALLIQQEVIEYRAGEVSPTSIEEINGRYRVALIDGTILTDEAEIVLFRHGPRPALSRFTEIWKLLEPARQYHRSRPMASDVTRRPMWDIPAHREEPVTVPKKPDLAPSLEVFQKVHSIIPPRQNEPQELGSGNVPPNILRSLARFRNALTEALRSFFVSKHIRCSVNEQVEGLRAVITAELEPSIELSLDAAEFQAEITMNGDCAGTIWLRCWYETPRVLRGERLLGRDVAIADSSAVASTLETMLRELIERRANKWERGG